VDLTSRTIASGIAPTTVIGQVKTLEMLVDRASIEIFVNDGEVSLTRFVLPDENGLSVKAEGGDAVVQSLVIYPPQFSVE